MAHTPGPLRKSPSGPLANLPAPPAPVPSGQFPFYHVENITFGPFVWERVDGGVNESQSTHEQDILNPFAVVQIWPLPPADDLLSLWDVIVNPIPIGDGGRPAWMDMYSISHVRIENYATVLPDGVNPTIPPGGAQAANVIMGLSLLQEILPVPGIGETTTLTTLITVDLMFFRRGIVLNRFNNAPA